MSGTRFTLEVQPRIPEKLRRLVELSNDLLYSWERTVRSLFFRLDPPLWESCGHNPKLFLRRVSQQRLDEAAEDRLYIEAYKRALSAYDSYLQEGQRKSIISRWVATTTAMPMSTQPRPARPPSTRCARSGSRPHASQVAVTS